MTGPQGEGGKGQPLNVAMLLRLDALFGNKEDLAALIQSYDTAPSTLDAGAGERVAALGTAPPCCGYQHLATFAALKEVVAELHAASSPAALAIVRGKVSKSCTFIRELLTACKAAATDAGHPDF